jgi:hypothetical protein
MGLPWWLVVEAAEDVLALRRARDAWPAGFRFWHRGSGRNSTTADNRVFVATVDNRLRTEGPQCSADSGTGLLDGTRLPTF